MSGDTSPPHPTEPSSSISAPDEVKASPRPLGWVRSVGLATLLLCVASGLSIALSQGNSNFALRTTSQLFNLGQHAGLGLLAMAIIASWQYFKLKRWLSLALLSLVYLGIAAPLFEKDFENFAWRLLPAAPWVIIGLVSVGTAVGLTGAMWLGIALRHWAARVLLLVAGFGLVIANHILPGGYPGVHLFLALGGGSLISAGLHSIPVKALYWERAVKLTAGATLVLFSAWALIAWPGTGVVMELTRHQGSVWMPLRAQMHQRASSDNVKLPINAHQWFSPRDNRADIPASNALKLPESPILLYLSIDGLRVKDLAPEYEKHFPFLAKLRDQSVFYTNARTPGSQTVYSLSSIFSCRYFSQLYWTKKEGQFWPAEDEHAHFPELLTKSGVQTFSIVPAFWLVKDYGIIRGFSYEEYTKPRKGVRYQEGNILADSIIKQLGNVGEKPAFGFTHFLDTHGEMRGKGPNSKAFDRHLAGLKKVDDQLQRIDKYLIEKGLRDRVIYIITSDHGEAYGERGKYGHTFYLYDELLRVPLLISAKGLSPRKVNTPVSAIDLGPTILDLFGQSTPGRCMGQSLVPNLANKKSTLTRPIVAEGRLKKAMLFDDRYKIILDDHANTEEAYDLSVDPQEKKNLLEDSHEEAENMVGLVRQFFNAHTLKRPGYKVPYRR